MRSHTYSRFTPGDGDAVDLEALLEQLADFLLQSGFAGGPTSHPWWGEVGEEADRSLEALKRAILEALIESGQFTPEMLAAMRGEGDAESEARLSDLLDRLVQRLVEQGYLSPAGAAPRRRRLPAARGQGEHCAGSLTRRAVPAQREGHRLPRATRRCATSSDR